MAKHDETGSASAELEQALGELKLSTAKKRAPTRYHARAILVALGQVLLGEGDEAGAASIRRLGEIVAPQSEAWEKAVRDELSLACAEHVLGVDPRYLEHPRFDFEYVVAARERLEARLVAASALDLSPPEASLDELAAADRRLEPYLERDPGGPGTGS